MPRVFLLPLGEGFSNKSVEKWLPLARGCDRSHLVDSNIRGQGHSADDEAAFVQEGPGCLMGFLGRLFFFGITLDV